MKQVVTTAALVCAAILGFAPEHRAEAYSPVFASEVVSYTSGTAITSDPDTKLPYTNTSAVLGEPNRMVGVGTSWPGVLSPGASAYQASEIVQVGQGGSLVLRLAQPVQVLPGVPELGIFTSTGLSWDFNANKSYPGAPLYSTPNTAVVDVSADGVNWVTLGLQTFEIPSNGYANATAVDQSSIPENPVLSDFGKPFLGTRSDFGDKTYAEILTLLNGSAGGTWLDLDSTNLTEVGYVRFSNSTSTAFSLDGVAAIPEPASAGLLLSGLLWLGAKRRRS